MRLETEAKRHARWNTPEASRIRSNRLHSWPQWALNALLVGELKAQGPLVAVRAAALCMGPNAVNEHHGLAHEWHAYETQQPGYAWVARDAKKSTNSSCGE